MSAIGDRQNLIKLFQRYNQRLGILYGKFVKELSLLGISVEDKLQDNPLFMFDHFPELKTRLSGIIKDYKTDYVNLYKQGISSGVALAFGQDAKNLHGYTIYNDDAINRIRTAAINAFTKQRMSPPFGLSLSQKIWNYLQQTKSEFEVAMSNVITDGLKKGTSAAELSRQVRQQLVNPDMMYRRYHHKVITAGGKEKDVVKWHKRVIDGDGKVRFVEAPLEQVGRGVYRSSYKNSFRLMRTEINMSYHYANNERWKSEPFVIGMRIFLSPEHPKYDMCDELVGDYPKDFNFCGFHVQCLCASSAILCSKEELKEITKRAAKGEDLSQYKSPNLITKCPENFNRYIDGQHDKILVAAERGTLGYYLRDNKKYWANRFSAEERQQMGISEVSSTNKAKQIAQMRHAKRTPEQIASIQNRWDRRKDERIYDIFDRALDFNKNIKAPDYVIRAHKAIFDNRPYSEYKDDLRKAEKWAATINKANLRHEARTAAQAEAIQKRWDERRISNIPSLLLSNYTTAEQVDKTFKAINERLQEKWFERGSLKLMPTNKNTINGDTDGNGIILLKTDRLNAVLSALSKIGSGRVGEISFNEADAMATFWHEITHNRNKFWFTRITTTQRRYMELANELVARHTLPEFYKTLGVDDMPFKEFITNRASTGYNRMVTRYDYVLDVLNLDKDKVYSSVRNHLFNADYTKQVEGLKQGLVDGGIHYLSKDKKGNYKAIKKSDLSELVKLIKDASDYYKYTNGIGSLVSKNKTIEEWLRTHDLL